MQDIPLCFSDYKMFLFYAFLPNSMSERVLRLRTIRGLDLGAFFHVCQIIMHALRLQYERLNCTAADLTSICVLCRVFLLVTTKLCGEQ